MIMIWNIKIIQVKKRKKQAQCERWATGYCYFNWAHWGTTFCSYFNLRNLILSTPLENVKIYRLSWKWKCQYVSFLLWINFKCRQSRQGSMWGCAGCLAPFTKTLMEVLLLDLGSPAACTNSKTWFDGWRHGDISKKKQPNKLWDFNWFTLLHTNFM